MIMAMHDGTEKFYHANPFFDLKVEREKGGRLDEQGYFTNKPGSIYRTWYQDRSSSQDVRHIAGTACRES